MTIFHRAMLSIRHNPGKNFLIFLLNAVFISALFFLFLIFNQLKLSLDAIQSVLDSTTSTTNKTDFFQSLVQTITDKINPIMQTIYLILGVGVLLFITLYTVFFFLRKQEFTNFQLMGEKKSRIYGQLILEKLIIVNSILFTLLLISIFFRAPLANQLNQVEQDLVDHHFQKVTVKSLPVTEKKEATSASEGSIYESGVSHFNTAVVTETNIPSTVEPQNFSLFVLFINLLTLLCLSPTALWFIYRTGAKKYTQFN